MENEMIITFQRWEPASCEHLMFQNIGFYYPKQVCVIQLKDGITIRVHYEIVSRFFDLDQWVSQGSQLIMKIDDYTVEDMVVAVLLAYIQEAAVNLCAAESGQLNRIIEIMKILGLDVANLMKEEPVVPGVEPHPVVQERLRGRLRGAFVRASLSNGKQVLIDVEGNAQVIPTDDPKALEEYIHSVDQATFVPVRQLLDQINGSHEVELIMCRDCRGMQIEEATAESHSRVQHREQPSNTYTLKVPKTNLWKCDTCKKFYLQEQGLENHKSQTNCGGPNRRSLRPRNRSLENIN